MRGSIRRRGPSWTLVLDLGYQTDPETGAVRRKQKRIKVQGTKKEAQDKLTELLGNVRTGQFVEPSRMTLNQWLTHWIDGLAASPVTQPATVKRYRSIVARVAKDSFGGLRIQAIRPSHVETYYSKLLAALKPSTLTIYHCVLNRAIRAALRDRIVPLNVCTEVENRPKRARDSGEHARVQCWTVAEARRFLAAADAAGLQASAFYALALDTGARLRELAGLIWADVNLDTGCLTIARQLRPGAAQAPQWGPTKTGKPRDVIVTPETVSRLKAHRRQQAEIKMLHRTRYQDFGLVFAKEHAHVRRGKDSLGQPLQVNNIGERQFGPLAAVAGVRRIKFHGLRHTHATLQLAAGEPVRDVADRLGHAKASMTLDIYAHATERKAPDTIRRVLFG